jgi:hypothetical protein
MHTPAYARPGEWTRGPFNRRFDQFAQIICDGPAIGRWELRYSGKEIYYQRRCHDFFGRSVPGVSPVEKLVHHLAWNLLRGIVVRPNPTQVKRVGFRASDQCQTCDNAFKRLHKKGLEATEGSG